MFLFFVLILSLLTFLFCKFFILKFFSIFKQNFVNENEEFILHQLWKRFFLYKTKKELLKGYKFKYLKKNSINEILHGLSGNVNLFQIQEDNSYQQNNNSNRNNNIKKSSEFYLRDLYFFFY